MRFPKNPARALVLGLVVLVVALFSTHDASAHQAGLSRGEYTVHGGDIDVSIVFSNTEISASMASLDGDHDGRISMVELDAEHDALTKKILDPLVLRADGDACKGVLDDARIESADGLSITAKYACSHAPAHLSIDVGFLENLSFTHRHLAEIKIDSTVGNPAIEPRIEERVAIPANHVIEVDIAAAPGKKIDRSVFGPLFKMGIEHILTGYDHLMFLFGLVLIGGRTRSLIALVTAFTIAHSISLALATLGIFTPSPVFIEPAIALSIAYVGVENFFVKNAEKRWRITFPFGLIHGFGFAGALREIALPHAQVPLALFAFNLGVEAGQLGVLALVLPILHFARKNAWFKDKGVKIL
ncbi:MAG: HupE/UreJ family protein, partial [Polyangiaceae bacterium]